MLSSLHFRVPVSNLHANDLRSDSIFCSPTYDDRSATAVHER